MMKDKNETHFFITLPVKCVIRNKSAGKQPSSSSFLQFDNSVTINVLCSHWQASCLMNDKVQKFQKEKA